MLHFAELQLEQPNLFLQLFHAATLNLVNADLVLDILGSLSKFEGGKRFAKVNGSRRNSGYNTGLCIPT